MPTRYELWKEPDGYSFFPEGNASAKGLLSCQAELVWTVEADSWDEANRKKNEFLGWEPYAPMKD